MRSEMTIKRKGHGIIQTPIVSNLTGSIYLEYNLVDEVTNYAGQGC